MEHPLKLGITGSTGFIGSYLCPSLPYPQKRLVRQPTPSTAECEFFKGDLQDEHALTDFVQNLHTLIHLGHMGHPRNSLDHIPAQIHQNLSASVRLFETFAKCNPQGHLIFASTGGNMYAPTNAPTPFTEMTPATPFSSYSILKAACEQYLKMFCQTYTVSATILRISNPYGLILDPVRAHGLIGVAFAKVLRQEPFTILDSPSTVRDYLHLDDLTAAFQKVLDSPPQPGECRLYNVGSGQGHTIEQVLDAVQKITGKPLPRFVAHTIPQATSPAWNVLSYEKIQQDLGWQPKIKLEQGLEIMWERRHQLLHTFKGPL